MQYVTQKKRPLASEDLRTFLMCGLRKVAATGKKRIRHVFLRWPADASAHRGAEVRLHFRSIQLR